MSKKLSKKYLPNSHAWKNSAILFVLTHATELIFPILIFWVFIALLCYCILTLNPLALIFILCSLLSFCLVFISHGLALIPYSIVQIICNYIFNNSVNLLDLKLSQKDFDDKFTEYLLIVVISSLPFSVIQLISAIWSFPESKTLDAILNRIDINFILMVLSPSTVFKFSWIWLITAAYLYQSVNPRN